jgi:hypothetical protein
MARTGGDGVGRGLRAVAFTLVALLALGTGGYVLLEG